MLRNLERFHRPRTLARALALLREKAGRSAVLAGGTRLLAQDAPEITDVVDVIRLGLGGIEERRRFLRIGAATSIQDLLDSPAVVSWSLGLLPAACRAASASLLLRNMSTLGGEIMGAGSQAAIPAALLALDTRISFFDGAKRSLPISEYLAVQRNVSLGPHIITSVDIPKPSQRHRARVERVAQTPSSPSLALVAIAFELKRSGCAKCRIAVSAATRLPIRARSAEAVLDGQRLTPEIIQSSADAAVHEVECFDDQHASAEYRGAMVGVLIRRALLNMAAGIAPA